MTWGIYSKKGSKTATGIVSTSAKISSRNDSRLSIYHPRSGGVVIERTSSEATLGYPSRWATTSTTWYHTSSYTILAVTGTSNAYCARRHGESNNSEFIHESAEGFSLIRPNLTIVLCVKNITWVFLQRGTISAFGIEPPSFQFF